MFLPLILLLDTHSIYLLYMFSRVRRKAFILAFPMFLAMFAWSGGTNNLLQRAYSLHGSLSSYKYGPKKLSLIFSPCVSYIRYVLREFIHNSKIKIKLLKSMVSFFWWLILLGKSIKSFALDIIYMAYQMILVDMFFSF